MWTDAPGKGNEFWSWKDWNGTETYLTYMTKGKLRPKFAKNFSNEEVERFRQAWVEPVKADKNGEDSGNEYFINKHTSIILKQYPTFKDWDTFVEEKYESRMITLPSSETELFDHIRHTVFKELYYRKRMVPHAQQYKQVAGSVFMRVMEEWGKLDDAAFSVLKTWY